MPSSRPPIRLSRISQAGRQPSCRCPLDPAKQAPATRLIAKLNRLSRNVAFISRLLESGVELLCCDMPQANRLTLHILATVAEHERQMISERTKAALAAAKARRIRLGAPHGSDPSAARAERTRAATAFHDRVAPGVARLAGQGLSLQRIAAEPSRLRSVTSTGKAWYPGGNLARAGLKAPETQKGALPMGMTGADHPVVAAKRL